MLRFLLALVVVVLVVLVGVDIGTRVAVEHQLAQRAESYAPGTHVSVSIHAFPWLPNLVANGWVARITAHADHVSQGDFVLSPVDVAVTGVRIDRHLLLSHRQLDIVSIGSGTATGDMTQADLDRLLGVPVVLGSGTATVTVAGVTVTGSLSITNGRLALAAPGLPVAVPIPSLPLLPCLTQVTIVPGRLVGTCTFNQIPPALKQVLQSALAPPGPQPWSTTTWRPRSATLSPAW